MRVTRALAEFFGLLSDALTRLEELLLTLLLFGLMGLGLTQIILRNTGVALPWADGAMRAMVLWLAMVAGVMAAGKLRHIRINLIEHWLPEKPLAWVNRFSYAMAGGVSLMMCWYGLEMVALEHEFGAFAFLRVPTWAVQFIIPIGFALMAARFFAVAFSPRGPLSGKAAPPMEIGGTPSGRETQG